MTQAEDRYRLAIDFAVEGDIRFLSHRDMLRLFARAAIRAQLPLRYSEGFNPQPRLSIPLPRSVGVASDAERLVVEFSEPLDEDAALRRLQSQVPQGITLRRASRLRPGERCVPVAVTYRVELAPPDRSAAEQRVASLLDPSPVLVKRERKKTGRVIEVDLRPFLDTVTVMEDGVEMRLHLIEGTTARPAEVMAELGLQANQIGHLVRRREVQWQ